MKQEIVMASSNKGKIQEAQEILKEYKIVPISEFGIIADVNEDQATFEQNAIKKAETIAKQLNGKLCLADDSGIEIEILNGFPGVNTKRWLDGTDTVSVSDGQNTVSAIGVLEGYVAESPRGDNGFGFDEIFELESGKTLAELSNEEKNEISARKKALELLMEGLIKYDN